MLRSFAAYKLVCYSVPITFKIETEVNLRNIFNKVKSCRRLPFKTHPILIMWVLQSSMHQQYNII